MSPHDQVANHSLDFADRRGRRGGLFRLAAIPRRDQAAAAANAKKSARNAVRVTIAPVEKSDFPVYLTGLGTVQGFNTVLVRTRIDGQIDKIAFKEGQTGQPGRPARRDRPAALPGGARSGQGQEGPGRGQSRQRQSRSAALHQARRIRDPAADRHPAFHRRAIDRADRGRRCGDLQRPDPARLHPVKSPIPGVAGLRQVDIGNIVNASTQTGIVTIAQIEPIAVIFTAPEEQLPYINEAQAVAAAQGHRDHDRRQEAAWRTERWRWSTIRSTPPAAPSASRRCSTTRTTPCGRASRSRRGFW